MAVAPPLLLLRHFDSFETFAHCSRQRLCRTMPRSTRREPHRPQAPSAKSPRRSDVAPARASADTRTSQGTPGLALRVRRCAPPASSTPRDRGGRRGTARRSVPPGTGRSPRRAAQDADPGRQEETGLPGRPALDGHATRPSPQICSRIALAAPGSATTTPSATPPPDHYGHARLPWRPSSHHRLRRPPCTRSSCTT